MSVEETPGEPAVPTGAPRSLRPRALLGTMVAHAAGYALGAALLLRGGATLLTPLWDDAGRIASMGAWSLVAAYTALGFAGGAVLGTLAGAARIVGRIEAELRAAIERPPAEGASRLLPAFPLDRVEEHYARILDAVVDGTLGRLPLPRLLRSFVRGRLRAPLVEDFLQTARRSGRNEAGFAELRDWLLLRGLPWVTAPVAGPLRMWRLLATGVLAALAAIPVALALVAGSAGAGAAVLSALAASGAVVMVVGLRADPRGRDPGAWRLGVATLGAQLAAWPTVWTLAWDALGPVGRILLGVATLLGVRWSLVQALIRAGPRLDDAPATLPSRS